jgi:hypothetical protein
MSGTDGEERFTVGDDYVGNLDALTRDVTDIEALAVAALAGEPIDQTTAARLAAAPAGLGYEELTDLNAERRVAEEWGDVVLSDLIDPVALAQLDAWRASQRLSWERSDLLAVAISGLIGAAANLYDTQLDGVVMQGLAALRQTPLLQQWEKDAKGMPIDYMGSKFGGPAHRALSPGHDIGRFFNALNQVRTGTFEGSFWEYGEKFIRVSTTTPQGTQYGAVDPYAALALLLKHWAADFVTPMSLPLPGWTLFREIPDRDLRSFGQAAYAGDFQGSGLNLRSGLLSPGLGMVATELVIRTHVSLASWRTDHTIRLATHAKAKRTEMLLAAHAVAGATSIAKSTALAIAGEGPTAARHLNIPVLLRVGRLALSVAADSRSRERAGAPSWETMLELDAATWTLPEAVTLTDLIVA